MQAERSKERGWLGTRVKNGKVGPYEWQTWEEINTIVEHLARAYQHLDLLPEI